MAVDTNIGNELETAEIGFGQLIEKVGRAVGETTLKLAQTGAATAGTLATTLVDVIAVEEVNYDENGNQTGLTTYNRKIPLINFMDPVFYEWTDVRLQGTFVGEEFADASKSSSVSHPSSKNSGQSGLLIVLGLGRTTEDHANTQVETTQTSGTDVSFGSVRLNALLQPRKDIGVPKPKLSVQGPRLSILQGEVKTVMPGGTTPGERTMMLTITYTRQDGSGIPHKTLAIKTEGVSWEYVSVGQKETDEHGQVDVRLKRQLIPGEGVDPTFPPVAAVVSVRKGMVSTSSGMNI